MGLLVIVLAIVAILELKAVDRISHEYFNKRNEAKKVVFSNKFTYTDDGKTGWGTKVIDLSEYLNDKEEVTLEISGYSSLFNYKDATVFMLDPVGDFDNDGDEEELAFSKESLSNIIEHNSRYEITLNKHEAGGKYAFRLAGSDKKIYGTYI